MSDTGDNLHSDVQLSGQKSAEAVVVRSSDEGLNGKQSNFQKQLKEYDEDENTKK